MLRLVDLLFRPDPETLLLRDFDPLLLVLLESLEDPLLETLRLLLFDPLEDPFFPMFLQTVLVPVRSLLFCAVLFNEPDTLLVLLFDPL
jgi:hypothetical protein